MPPRSDRLPSAVLAATALAALLGACFSERSETTGPPGAAACNIPIDSPVIGSEQVLVAIRDLAFEPATLRIAPGTTVTWINCEPEGTDLHTTTSDDALWESDLLSSGDLFSYTFEETGTFAYHCIPHSFMTAEVIVE